MSLLSTPYTYDDKILEATVTNVDPIRFVCTVKTVRGQYFQEVPWLLPTGGSGKTGMHFTPSVGDQVVISTALTYPLILGALPRLGSPGSSLTNASGQTISTDAGNNTNMKNGYVANPNKPSDLVPGDMVWTNSDGGVFGLLANGSIVAKASALAQIFMTRFNDLVRVVARNWERFSDVSQHTAANVKGRMYEFFGWDRSLARSKLGVYELQDVVGDVAAGEVLLGEPNTSTVLPATDTRLRKYWLKDANGASRMVEIMYDNDKLDLIVQDAPGTTNTREVQDTNIYEVTSTSPTSSSKVTITPTNIILDHNSGTSKVVLDATAITSTHVGGASHILNGTSVKASFGAHFVTVDGSGVHLG